jgi:hypothetical protein
MHAICTKVSANHSLMRRGAQEYLGSAPGAPRDFIRRGLLDQAEGQLVR